MKKNLVLTCLVCITLISSTQAQRYMEKLNRGTVAVRTSTNEVLVSWRILGPEYSSNATYNLYRGSTRIASNLSVSNYVDNISTDESYSVSAVINGNEQPKSEGVVPWIQFYKTIPLSVPAGGTTPDGVAYTYTANDCSVGDLDGDGDYEIVLKWQPTNAKDNSQGGYTGNTILDGMEMDGTRLWRINLGINIRSGAHYTQFMVYDLDGDGDAEVACKTADGTIDGQGNVIGSSSADYRNSSGYILSGPEYLTVFSGLTGRALETVSYVPARGTVSDWGDSYGNRVDRFLACIAYLDGTRPSLVMCRGYYTRIVAAAWDYRDGNLTSRWVFDTNNGYSSYEGQGNHNLAVGDVDNDGKDEIMYGACAIDDDGSGLYSTGLKHGDAGHLSDINPNSSGLEYFMCHESANGSTIPGLSLRNAASGAMKFTQPASGDVGRCLTADIDPNYIGYEMWGSNGSGIHSCTGSVITTAYPTTAGGGWTYNFGIWWDGDLLRELLDRTVITKWNSANNNTDRISTIYNYGATSNNSTKYNPCLSADIMGDWREEIIYRHYENDKLIVFTTPYPTSQRMYTLMHDPIYRLSIAWQNVGYNMPPNVGFYFGVGMDTPPDPDIIEVGGLGNSEVWMEAECGNVGSLWNKFSDDNASNDQYVTIQSGNNSTDSAPTSEIGYITYTFDVSNGLYDLWARVITTADTDDSFWVKMDDGSWFLWNNLGIYTNWTWKQCQTYSLDTGSHTLTIAYREDGALLDKLYIGNISPSGEGATANNCGINTLTLQENKIGFCSVDGTIDNNNSGYTGDGFANTTNASENGITWSVNIPSDGFYQLVWRHANGGTSDRPARLIVDGVDVVSNVSFPYTGSWTTWAETYSTNINLTAGTKLIRLEATSSSGLSNIDYMSITGLNPIGVSCSGLKSAIINSSQLNNNAFQINCYPIPVTEILNIDFGKVLINPVDIFLINMTGKVVIAEKASGISHKMNLSELPKGAYFLKISNENFHRIEQIIKE
ncbi:rhamnogalacturonan lyase family protein [Geofilum sp. OHC36d9]|uniref:rhamnogalacturonan lyase family protein n=1 Tax=Geofilum sp. OHC36d9 TaxID=3458413 RepID=UPI00403374CE